MPDGAYYRKQAQLFASLAITTSDPHIAERFNQMALEQLAKAEEAEPSAAQRTHELHGGDSDGIDRD
jgi:hypothetical protein